MSESAARSSYAILGANVVVELYSESHARQPTTRAWAIIRRADRSHRLAGQRASRPERRPTNRADRTSRSQDLLERRWRSMPANLICLTGRTASTGSTPGAVGL
jgi:hypothetical protein